MSMIWYAAASNHKALIDWEAAEVARRIQREGDGDLLDEADED